MLETSDSRRLGVVIVTFNSAEVIVECLDSLFAASGVDMRVIVVDNHSSDGSEAVVKEWAAGSRPLQREARSPLAGDPPATRPIPFDERPIGDKSPPRTPLTIMQTGINGGFAFGVNRGLEVLLADRDIDVFWILNPDCAVPADTPAKLMATAKSGPFSMIGCRQIYYDDPDIIQTDAFRLDRKTGVCVSVNAREPVATAVMPDDDTIDFVSGATMAVSRQFIDTAGLMDEDYFLYYEEPAWAMRKGDLPIRLVPGCVVYHHSGTAIGTGSIRRRSTPFANYFNHRNRMRFVRRHLPDRIFAARIHGIAKAVQLLLRFAPTEAWALLTGTLELPPPAQVSKRIDDPRVCGLAFGRQS